MYKSLLVIPLIALISACSPSTIPKCSAPEVIDTIKEIANEEMAIQLGSETAEKFTYAINSIRTTDENDKTGAFECAAQLEIHANTNDNSTEIPITYTVEKTDDGQDFYVNVFGLR
ncbi:hypothetical protein ES754_05415 [Psychrobacter frigidicola]|uniref:Lipoprotein n=1 Tax=Psychrobacter frigidicola TaxID=45611 RepID=A0A5C7A591_9GAMM|nr:hypothetical protein [Psychrobacter frigidicola]TXD98358.1 hypothetical protein ES754_05415 [Psychrobacter frigidicola]